MSSALLRALSHSNELKDLWALDYGLCSSNASMLQLSQGQWELNCQAKLQLYEWRQVMLYLPVTAEGYQGLCPLFKDQWRIRAVGKM